MHKLRVPHLLFIWLRVLAVAGIGVNHGWVWLGVNLLVVGAGSPPLYAAALCKRYT